MNNDMSDLYLFALECEDMFSDEEVDQEELLYKNSQDDIEQYEFMVDGAKEFIKRYGEDAYQNADAFESIMDDIDDYEMLGDTIDRRWDDCSDCKEEGKGIGSEENRKWFAIAFHKLADLVLYASPVFTGTLSSLEFFTRLPLRFEEEYDNKEVIQSFTLDGEGNFSLSSYRVNPDGEQPIKVRAAQFKLRKSVVDEIFLAVGKYYTEKRRSFVDILEGYYEVNLYNDAGESFFYTNSITLDEELRELSNTIREKVGMDDLFVFDGNKTFDAINHIMIDYHRTIYEDDDEGEENRPVRFAYHEILELDREKASLDIKRNIDDRCKMSIHYELEHEIPSFLDELSQHEVFQHVEPYPDDIFHFPDIEQTYTICINYEHEEDRVLKGYFDAEGLPVDYDNFAKALLYLISLYRFSELLDDSYFNKINPRVDDLLYCSVTFDEDDDHSYYYISDDYHIQEGDLVLVPTGEENEPTIARVVKVEYVSEDEVPYPIEKTKHIIRKCTIEDIDDFDFTS